MGGRRLAIFLALAGAVGASQARDGQLDLGFGTFGKTFAAVSGSSYVYHGGAGLAIQADGRLVLAGTRYTLANNLYDYDISVIRLNADGSKDANFGSAGETAIALNRTGSGNGDYGNAVLVQGDGKIVVAGSTAGDTTTGEDMVAVRLTAGGGLDPGFGNGGKAFVPFNLGSAGHLADVAFDLTQDSQGKLLLVGEADCSTASIACSKLAVVRLNTDGTRDTSFSADGRVVYGYGSGAAAGFKVRELANHKILAVGYVQPDPLTDNVDFLLVRFDTDGSLDNGFGSGGAVRFAFDIGGNMQDAAGDFVELDDGSLLVAGLAVTNAPYNTDMALMKFSANGMPYPGFVPATYPLDFGGDLRDSAMAIRRDSQGRILLAGMASTGTYNGNNVQDFVVVRLTAAGQPDARFGNGGRVVYTGAQLFGTDMDNSGATLAIDAQERIVTAGTAAYTATDLYKHRFVVIRMRGDTIFEDPLGG